MGAVFSCLRFGFILVMTSYCHGAATGADDSNKAISIFIGLAGHGKSTIIGKVCDAKLKTGSGIKSCTEYAEAVDCGDQIVVDTAGLNHLIDDGKPVENAFYEGLENLLSYMDGKKFGRIYVVVSSVHLRDKAVGRLLEQVDFIKSIMNPLIPWTSVVNCNHGVCPSSLEPQEVPELIGLLAKRTETQIEVVNPKQAVDKSLFPAPKVSFTVDLPPDWRERIKVWDIAYIRENMKAKAVESCKEHQAAFLAASDAIKVHQCTVKECAAPDCSSLPACPDFSCHVPPCGNNDQCKTSKTTKDSSMLGLDKTTTTETGMDSGCLNEITVCNTARAKACDAQMEAVTQCNNDRSEQCLKHKENFRECGVKRTETCLSEMEGVKTSNEAVMEQHKAFVDQCQKFYTMK